MKDLAVILLFLCALSSVAMAFKLREAHTPLELTVEHVDKKPAVDAGSTRGRPGEDDTDEEDEEDLRANPRSSTRQATPAP